MRETVAQFESRSGQRYRPPAWLRAVARPFAPDDACPTLFRYPGPCGLRELWGMGLPQLGPATVQGLWVAEAPLHEGVLGAAHFGTLALLEPLRLHPCRATEDTPVHTTATLLLALNRPTERCGSTVWVPPSRLHAPLPWDSLQDPREARALMEPGWEEERREVHASLGAYLEEMGELQLRGAPGPHKAWCEVPREERRELLSRFGAKGRWTGRLDAATCPAAPT
ncbi:MAG: hypothetical protein AMXMBFR64_20510 [Myxococcales bacterium]